ncbi:serine-rich coiled-coil domain-containing protein 2 isoform X3 [Ambystoma mexicanum]|uniref:serine-rich coiled-coil domain-containing protein 2 isoform X3 n=1 Tax=Ambystoma mexicanum TaxID=8296 RepID=UPI0037E7B8F5
MEEKVHVRPSLGSRLPKFGGTKSGESLLQHMANGSPVGVLGNSNGNNGRGCMKQNGAAPTSTASASWKQTDSHSTNDQSTVAPANPPCNRLEKVVNNKKYLRREGGGGKEALKLGLKNTPSGIAKSDRPANMFVSPTEELNQKPSPGFSHSAKFTKGTFVGRTSYSGLNPPKPQVNGCFANRPAVDLPRPRANSVTVRSSSKEGLAQTTDSMKSLSCERIIRSQSFSHSIQNSLLPTATLTRSHSFNRAVDLTKPYQNQHATIRAFQRSNLLSRSARQSEIPSATEPHLKYNFSRTALPVANLKKPRLPNGPGLVTPLGYQMSRPSLLKPNRPQFAPKMVVDGARRSANLCILEKSEHSQSNNGRATDEQKALMETSHQVADHMLNDDLETSDSKVQYFSDDVDEISISSLSSSDKNDLSEDFSDDFLDFEDANSSIIKVQHETNPSQKSNTIIVDKAQISPALHCKTEEWINTSISERSMQAGDMEDGKMLQNASSSEETTCLAEHEALRVATVQNKNENSEKNYEIIPISPDMDYREGSSLELSPSDSSDGTYMWDEEGLEPIGSVHPCGSYESSEMNSIDVLNNLDSCDIEDDDLMLDVDLPEDTPSACVDAGNMNHFERTERNIRQPQQVLWKRSQQQRCNGQEPYRLSRGTGIVEGYGAHLFQAPRVPQIMGFHDNIVMLDEMTLRHMVQDCTSVKTQLLKLKRLLQSEETESLLDSELSTPVTPEPLEADNTLKDAQFEEIDGDFSSQVCEDVPNNSSPPSPKVINSSYRATRCNCHKETQQTIRVIRPQCDKFTQTPWRKVSPQILHPPSSIPSTTDQSQGRLARTPRFEDHSKLHDEALYENVSHRSQNPVTCSETIGNDPNELSDLLSTQLQIKDSTDNALEEESLQTENKLPVYRKQAWKEGLQLQTTHSFVETTAEVKKRTELPAKLSFISIKKTSNEQNSRPKTLQLFKPKKEVAVEPPREAPFQSRSPTCKKPQSQTMDDMLAELSLKDDVQTDLQATKGSPSQLPPGENNQLQPTASSLLQLHVTVASPSQLHFTVSSPSQLWPINAGSSQIQGTGLSELPSQLESVREVESIDSPTEKSAPDNLLIHSQADRPYNPHIEFECVSQSSTFHSAPFDHQMPSLEKMLPEVADICPMKSLATAHLPAKITEADMEPAAGCLNTLMSVVDCPDLNSPSTDLTWKSAVPAPIMLKSPTASPTIKPPSTSHLMSRSPAASPTTLKSPTASQMMLKSPAANSSLIKCPTTKPLTKGLPAGPSMQKIPVASPTKQNPPASLSLAKSTSVTPAQLQPSATTSSTSVIKQSPRSSKLRPPSIFLSKSKQNNNADKPTPLAHQDPPKSPVKAAASNIPRPLPQKKDLHHGDGTNANRLTRLPKPKTQ